MINYVNEDFPDQYWHQVQFLLAPQRFRDSSKCGNSVDLENPFTDLNFMQSLCCVSLADVVRISVCTDRSPE